MNKKNQLWGDCKTDKEKYEFIKSGKAWETGIMAMSICKDIENAYKELIDLKNLSSQSHLNPEPRDECRPARQPYL